MTPARGQLLLIGGLLMVSFLSTSRALFTAEESPAFILTKVDKVMVELADGFPAPGIHQFIDGTTCLNVINLTGVGNFSEIECLGGCEQALQSGEHFALFKKATVSRELRVAWMMAAKRVALGIPLHPDRMTEEDWTVLPGIGANMAKKIEENRQKYGDFNSFDSLKRVPGIGAKRLSSWDQYFFCK